MLDGLADNFAPVLERLAGTQSDLKLSFEDLTLDTGTVKARIRGSIVIDAVYSKRQEKQMPRPAEVRETSDNIVSRTVVTNVTTD